MQATYSPIIELRRYRLRPGARDVLIRLFEQHFVEPQEEAGMKLVGQFRDLDDDDLFVWVRGFTTMAARRESLAAFYGGPVWSAHREAANETMVDSDNVLLLRPARPGSAFQLPAARAGVESPGDRGRGRVGVLLAYFDRPVTGDLIEHVGQAIDDAAAAEAVLACFVTEPAANTFPRLPVREGEHVLAVFTGQADQGPAGGPARSWFERLLTTGPQRPLAVESLRLEPTARSLLQGEA